MRRLFGRGLPPLSGRSQSTAADPGAASALGVAVARLRGAPHNHSGVHPLRDAQAAFAARIELVRSAERSLDLQYYIWNGDLTGTLLFRAVHQAAERGVRVRLLLDDNSTAGLDTALTALDVHRSIEVRLFNPFTLRRARWLNGLLDFSRLNRRMHNKSFTADNQVSIVGGRNIGDEYFGAAKGVRFTDLDVLAVGPVAQSVSADFDRYWACASAVPLKQLLAPATPDDLHDLAERAAQIEGTPQAADYVEAVRQSDTVDRIRQGSLNLEWVPVELVSDDPDKALGQVRAGAMFPARLAAALGQPQRSLDLISPYFVPGASGVADLADLVRKGVKVRVLTNALESTDVAVVHAGYAKRRKALLDAGVVLYELRRTAAGDSGRQTAKGAGIGGRRSGRVGGRRGSPGGSGYGGSSAASLHAKTFGVDRERIFIGSFNFDPRSARLNTELGFVIHSPQISDELATAFDQRIPQQAYEVQLDGAGKLVWIERSDGDTLRHASEPGTSPARRLWLQLLSHLPIEWLL